VSELAEWERHTLADLARRLADEDPGLAARLSGPMASPRPRLGARIGRTMFWAGIVLLLCGIAQAISPLIAVGFGMLTVCWLPMPFWRRSRRRRPRTGRGARSSSSGFVVVIRFRIRDPETAAYSDPAGS
jgi:hypothetical protein